MFPGDGRLVCAPRNADQNDSFAWMLTLDKNGLSLWNVGDDAGNTWSYPTSVIDNPNDATGDRPLYLKRNQGFLQIREKGVKKKPCAECYRHDARPRDRERIATRMRSVVGLGAGPAGEPADVRTQMP